MGRKFFPSKNRKTATLNLQNIRMLQTHVNNDIYNKYCLIHNNMLLCSLLYGLSIMVI